MADGLFEQLRGISEGGAEIPSVSMHDLAAMVREVRRGKVTGGQAKTALGLTDQAVTELALVIAEVNANNLTEQEVSDIFGLVQSKKFYTDKTATKTRLGI